MSINLFQRWERVMVRPKVDFRPWLVSSDFGDTVLREEAPEDIKKAWEKHNKLFEINHPVFDNPDG